MGRSVKTHHSGQIAISPRPTIASGRAEAFLSFFYFVFFVFNCEPCKKWFPRPKQGCLMTPFREMNYGSGQVCAFHFSQTASLWWGSPYTKFLKMQLGSSPAKHFWPAGVSILSRWCPDGVAMVWRRVWRRVWRGRGEGVARVWRSVARVWRFSRGIFAQCKKYALRRFPATDACWMHYLSQIQNSAGG